MPAQAGIRHEDAYLATYTDFGQNRGRYVVGARVNALLEHIRQQDGGITIEYKDGTPTYTISNEQGMIDFRGAPDVGHSALVGNNFLVTVQHNGALNCSFSGDDVGSEHAIYYTAVDIRKSDVFRLVPGEFDFMVQRQTKLATDAVSTPIVSVNDLNSLKGELMYHVGSGSQGVYTEHNKTYNSYCGAYVYNIGDIVEIRNYGANAQTGDYTVGRDPGFGDGIGASEANPLPSALRAGDSGSPMFIYNQEAERYEFLAAVQSGNPYSADYGRGNVQWMKDKIAQFDVAVNLTGATELHLGAVSKQGDTLTDSQGISTTIYTGTISDAGGNALATYKGLQTGNHTWRALNDRKDNATWYTYDSDTYDESGNPDGYLLAAREDLFFTENLVFSSTAAANTIILDDTVDLGAGYAEFKSGKYTISSAAGEKNLFNTSGYVIHEGAEVHLQFTNPEDYMREWRKTGAGALYIDGEGDTNAFLNLGGSGTTYLQQTNGHAAYNVLVNMGARVAISSTSQIERDLTFGSGGGTLDMNGNSMDWYTTDGQNREDSFTINALTEEAMITNSAAKDVTLTYMEGGETTWLGSFTDNADGALVIDYKGGGTWTLNSIHTDLSKNAGSGLHVSDGTVVFSGVNTIHGWGSASGRNKDRLVEVKDWHYADAKMNVTVKDGGTFELGSHARLDGDVAVQSGGTFIMHEGVQHALEYIEGGTSLQSTADISDFYGLKGDVTLAEGATMRVEFSQDTTVANTYAGTISGAGSLKVALGAADKKLILSGDNSGHTGAKELASGYLVAETLNSLGNTSSHTWKMTGEDAVISSHEGTAADLLARVHGDSVGTLALSNDTATALGLGGHKGLFIGAEEGKVVHYGQSGVELDAVDGKWQLGGGGGELYVDFKLSGANNLELGVSQTASGTVVLNNGTNDFSGDITFSGKGLILKSVAGGLGFAKLDLNYGNALGASSTDVIDNENLKDGSNGILLVNDLNNADVDLSDYAGLALGAQNEASYRGNITLADGADYHFSAAAGGSLTVWTELDADRKIVVDGQGLTGGKVVLNGNATLNGDLVVRGNAEANSHGDMTFALGRNMATTGAVTVENGGVIDLAGFNLSIAGSLSGIGGSIIDSSGHAELSFNAEGADVSSAAYMDLATVRKTGSRNFSLTNDNVNIDNLYVEAGSVTMGSGTRSMTVHLSNDTYVDVGGNTVQFDLNMAFNGGVAELKHTGNTGTVTLAGDVTLGGGSQLNLYGGTGVTYALNGASYGGGNAVLSVKAKKVEFNTQSTTILGTLRAENDLEIYSNANGELERSISQLDIANGSQVTLNERTWKTIWNIDSLTGEGVLHWNSNTTHYNTSRLILKGDGGFTGTISLARNRNNASRTHGAFIELASDTAAKNAVISLSGTHANSVASLAVNTHNAMIKGLEGNANSYVYAGESMDAAELSGTARPTATRNATLVVDVDSGKEYTYAGALGCTADTANAGLNLVKTGAGVQHLTGTIATNNLTVQQGTLNISQAPVRGNLAIGLGATLNAGDTLVLGSGQRLSAVAGVDGATGSAVLDSSLSLNGGSLGFDGGAVVAANAVGNAALSLQGITLNGTANINFTNYTALKADVTYTLATGDWSGLTSSLTSSGLGYYAASFSTNESGHLQMSLTNGGSAILWKGTADNYEWTRNNFGPGNGATTDRSVVVFEDSAANKTVNMTTTQVTVSEIIFNNTDTYTVKRGNDGFMTGATAGSLSVVNTGEVIIEDCIKVTGKTVVDNGILTCKMGGLLMNSEVSGTGTLKVDWGSNKIVGTYEEAFGLKVNGLRTLHIANGTLGTTDGTAMLVENVILDSAGTYMQGNGVDQTTNFVVNGGTINLGSGSLNGTLSQNGNATIAVRGGGDAYLNSRLTQNGRLLTQSGGGTLHIGADSAAVLQNYKISNGTLRYDSGAMSEGNGTLEVAGGTLHVQNGAGLEASLIKVSGGKLQVDAGASLMGNTALHLSNAAATAKLESYNSYTGGTTIDAGTLEVTANGGLGTGAVYINGGDLVVGAAARGALGSISGLSMSGGTLNLSDIRFNPYDAMALNGEFSVSGGTINLGSYINATDTPYAIFDISHAVLDWSLDALGENLMVNGTRLSGYKDVTLGVNGGLATITFGSFDLNRLILNSGEAESFTEAELIGHTTDIIVSKGATLTMTSKDTVADAISSAFNKVSGEGTLKLNLAADNGVGFNLSGITGTVEVATGRLQVNTSTFNDAATIHLSSAASHLVFNGTGTELKNKLVLDAATSIYVNNGKTGTISGIISGNGGFTKEGAGTLTLTGANAYSGTTTVANGTLSVSTDGALGTSAVTINGGTLEVNGGNERNANILRGDVTINGGKLLIKGHNNKVVDTNVTVNTNGTMEFEGSGSDMLDYNQQNKSITVNGGTLDFGTTRQTMGEWKLNLSNGAKVTGAGGTYNGKQAALDYNNPNKNVINATAGNSSIESKIRLRGNGSAGTELAFNVAQSASLNVSGLVHSDGAKNGIITKQGAGTLHLNNTNNDLARINVTGGTANIHGAEDYTLNMLELAAGSQAGFYSGATTAETLTRSTLTVSQLAKFAEASTLNADLVLASGASLELGGGMTLNGMLSLQTGLTLSGAVLSEVLGLEAGESYELFTGVNDLLLQEVAAQYNLRAVAGQAEVGLTFASAADGTQVAAGDYFTNLADCEGLVLSYNAETGTVRLVQSVPEPTTAALSLLALAALAARRRRK